MPFVMHTATNLLFCTIGATALSFDVTFNIIGATNLADLDGYNDKSDPFAGIFVNDRLVGLTPSVNNNHNPTWNTHIEAIGVSPSDEIKLIIFDRDDGVAAANSNKDRDIGDSFDQMQTQNDRIGGFSANVADGSLLDYALMAVGARGSDWWRSCFNRRGNDWSCPPYGERATTVTDTNNMEITYDMEIICRSPECLSSPPPPTPAPPPPPAPSPPPPCDARCRKDALRERVLESLRSRVSPPSASPRMRAYYADTSSEDEPFIIPRWLTGVLSFVGSIILSCVLRKAIRYVCSGNNNAPRSMQSFRSQTDPNAISVEMESASPSASVDLPRILTPMSELEREQYVRLFKSLGGYPVGRAAAAPTFERAQLPPDDLDAIWAL